MDRRRSVLMAALVLVPLLGGCKWGRLEDPLPVGTCVLVDDRGTATVPCTEPHTHKVIAIAPRPEACPIETDMSSQPADPDYGQTTTCFQSHTDTD
jgi:hypothetical protein